MLTLIVGKPKSGKTAELLKRVQNSTFMGISSRIIITPEQMSHSLERKLVDVCGNGISLYAEILSFSRLANRVFSIFGGTAICSLDEAGRLMAVKLAMDQLQASNVIQVFSKLSQKTEFLAQTVHTIDEIMRSGITGTELASYSEKVSGSLSCKMRELSMLLSTYQGLIAQGYADPCDALNRLHRMLVDTDYATNREFFVDGFSDFTVQEQRILETLLVRSKNLTITVLLDDSEKTANVYDDGRDVMSSFLKIAKQNHIESQIIMADYCRPRSESLNFVANHFLSYSDLKFEKANEDVILNQCNDRLEECRRCASFLKKSAMEGIRFREMFIAVCNNKQYEQILKESLNELDIPFSSNMQKSLAEFPCVSHLLLAIESVTRGMRQDSVLAYLKSGYASVSNDAIDILENYAYIWRVKGNAWFTTWTQHPDGFSGKDSDGTAVTLEHINRMREKAIGPLQRLARRLKNSETVRNQMEAIYRFILETKLYEQLECQINEALESGNEEKAQELSQVWKYLMSGLQQVVSLMGNASASSEALFGLLKIALSSYKIGIIPSTIDCVQVGDIADVRGNEPKVLCIIGATDRDLPTVSGTNCLITDEERKLLLEQCNLRFGITSEKSLNRQMLQIYCALSAPSEYLYISWPAKEGGGEVHSSYVVSRVDELFLTKASINYSAFGYTIESLTRDILSGKKAISKLGTTIDGLNDCVQSGNQRALEPDRCISKELVQRLFGTPINLTASKIDLLNRCPLSFFYRYGLAVKERKVARFDAGEFGTFIHRVLELSIPDIIIKREVERTDELIFEIVENSIQKYKEEHSVIETLSARERYLFKRNGIEAFDIVCDAANELAVSEFVPFCYELKFGKGEIPSIPIYGVEDYGRVTGTIDRIDLWKSDSGNFYRVVDYKSAEKKINFTELYHGIGMQMFVYLFQVDTHAIFGSDEKYEPIGAQYFPAKCAFKNSDDLEKNSETLLRAGIVLDDDRIINAMENDGLDRFLPAKRKGKTFADYVVSREQFDDLKWYAKRVMRKSMDRILSGKFTAEPFYGGRNELNACEHCIIPEVCQADSGYARAYYCPKLKAKDFWTAIREENDGQS